MKVIVEFDDAWIEDEEGSIQDAVKNHIVWSVTNDVKKHFAEKVEKEVTDQVTAEIEKSLHAFIQQEVINVIDKETIKINHYDEDGISLSDYIKTQFTNHAGKTANPNEYLTKLANKFGNEMKERYDLLFASQLVAKLADNGLLKDDAIKLLLDKTKG